MIAICYFCDFSDWLEINEMFEIFVFAACVYSIISAFGRLMKSSSCRAAASADTACRSVTHSIPTTTIGRVAHSCAAVCVCVGNLPLEISFNLTCLCAHCVVSDFQPCGVCIHRSLSTRELHVGVFTPPPPELLLWCDRTAQKCERESAAIEVCSPRSFFFFYHLEFWSSKCNEM